MTAFDVTPKTGARDSAADHPDTERDAAPPAAPLAVPGLALGSRKLNFAWTWTEIRSYPPQVQRAITDHQRCLLDIQQARAGLLARMPGELGIGFSRQLADIEAELIAMTASQISFQDREKVIVELARVQGRLSQAVQDAKLELRQHEAMLAAEEDRKRKEDEAKRREEEARAAEEQKRREAEERDRKERAAAEAKASAERKQREAAEAKAAEEQRKREEQRAKAEAERKKREEAAAKAAEEKRRREEAEADKRRMAEEAEQRRAALFGDRAKAYHAARDAADQHVEPGRKAELKEAEKLKPSKRAKTGHEAYAAKVAEINERHAGLAGTIVEQFGAVANSVSGQALSEDDLAWVVGAARRDPALAQQLADVCAGAGRSVAQAVAADPGAAELAPRCVDLLRRGVAADKVVTAARLIGVGGAEFARWLRDLAGTPNFDGAYQLACAHDKALGFVALVGKAIGTGPAAADLVAVLARLKAKIDDAKWLVEQAGQPGYAELCQMIGNKDFNLALLRKVVAAAAGKFTLQQVAQICSLLGPHADLPTAVGEADPGCISYPRLWLAVGSGKPPEELLRIAIRAEAMLYDKLPTFKMSVQRKDKKFGRKGKWAAQNKAVGARTGFLVLTFPDSIAYLHTHWEAKAAAPRITSMHVKRGNDKGLELNKWQQFFPLLTRAAVDTHNAGTGVLAPKGGPLNL